MRLFAVVLRYLLVIVVLMFRRLSFRLLHCSEQQRSKRQHANSADGRTAADSCKRRIDFETIGHRHLAGDKGEVSALNVDQDSRRMVDARTFLEHHARAIRDFESRAVAKIDGYATIGAGLDDVAPENRIAGFERSNSPTRPGDRRRTGHQCNLAAGQ